MQPLRASLFTSNTERREGKSWDTCFTNHEVRNEVVHYLPEHQKKKDLCKGKYQLYIKKGMIDSKGRMIYLSGLGVYNRSKSDFNLQESTLLWLIGDYENISLCGGWCL